MFAALVVEREPFTTADLPLGLMSWTQIVGALSMLGIMLWLVLGLPFMRRDERERIPPWQSKLFVISIILSAIQYFLFIVVGIIATIRAGGTSSAPSSSVLLWRNILLTTGGAFALFAVCLPVLRNLLVLRPRRIWALARLSFQEALRNKILYALSLLLVFFLFYNWFSDSKPESQLSSYVSSVFLVMTAFLLVIAVIISAFSIPNDIKNQTIHTVLTKPVERFEVVLGRFLGYTGLMTLVLLVMATLSLLYVVRGIDPDAAAESLKARDALYGDLSFENTGNEAKGVSVGKEWDYRTYIAAALPGKPAQYAVWSYNDVPKSFAGRATVPCEFSFDIYRTTKGKENVGIETEFAFSTWRFKKGDEDAYKKERDKERARGELSNEQIDNMLAKKYGYYEVPMNVTDYHTMTINVPGGLFDNAAPRDKAEDDRLKSEQTRRGQSTAPIQVRVKCTSPTQYIGMAKHDLYFRADNPNSGKDRLWFAWNFYKASFGLWLRLCLVIGVAVVLSTYLSGVISLLTTLLLLVLGFFLPFIEEIVSGRNVGGGPVEAALRLGRRDHLVVPLEPTTTNVIAAKFDVGYRFFMRIVANAIPDVYTSNFGAYIESGFNIGPERLLIAALLMFGYLLPWFLLGYYLLKWREIASAT
jgi:ABC-type transport system involved in multi-copper enzyme maturation permease subunit